MTEVGLPERLRVAALLHLTSLSLRLLGYERTRALHARLAGHGPVHTRDPWPDIHCYGPLITDLGTRGRIRALCLARSLALQTILRRRGIATHLCFGVTAPRDFQAHAWLEIDGRPINDSENVAARYRPLDISTP